MIAYFFHGGILGLRVVETSLWGGLTLTLVIAGVGIVSSLPIGIVLALGRRSEMPVVRMLCVGFIELIRAVPLITVLFMASVMLPLFLPTGVNFDKLLRALVGVVLFSSAYMAEVVRGGLQAIPNGQYEAAKALGLSYWKIMGLIVLPQALRIVIPGIVNTFIGLFKDTTLVLIIGLFDLLGMVQAALTDAAWLGFALEGYVFAGFVFWIFCFAHVALQHAARAPSERRREALGGRGMAATAGRRADHRAARRAQVVRRVPRPEGHQSRRLEGPEDRRLRAVGLGQVDDDPLHQPARGAPARPYRGRRHRADQRRQAHRRHPARGRHGVPAASTCSRI